MNTESALKSSKVTVLKGFLCRQIDSKHRFYSKWWVTLLSETVVETRNVSGTDAPPGGGHPWGRTSPSPPGALGWVVNPPPLGSAARGGEGMPSGECCSVLLVPVERRLALLLCGARCGTSALCGVHRVRPAIPSPRLAPGDATTTRFGNSHPTACRQALLGSEANFDAAVPLDVGYSQRVCSPHLAAANRHRTCVCSLLSHLPLGRI